MDFPKKGHDIITFSLYPEPFMVSDGCCICTGSKVTLHTSPGSRLPGSEQKESKYKVKGQKVTGKIPESRF